MRNEIETSGFLPAGQAVYFSSAGEVSPHHSAFMVEKDTDKRKSEHLYLRGLCSLGKGLTLWSRIQDVVSLIIKRRVVKTIISSGG